MELREGIGGQSVFALGWMFLIGLACLVGLAVLLLARRRAGRDAAPRSRRGVTVWVAACVLGCAFLLAFLLGLRYLAHEQPQSRWVKHGGGRAAVIAGPTADVQPAFDWRGNDGRFAHLEHEGQPDVWDFDWIETESWYP